MTNRPTDPREFVRVTADIYAHPKLVELADPAAAWAYIVALGYAGKNTTDGFIPLRAIAALAGISTQKMRKLTTVSLIHEPGHTCKKCPEVPKGQAYIHDYLEHQRSRHEVEESRRSHAERGRKGAAKRWGNHRQNPPKTPPETDSNSHSDSDGKPMAEVEEEKNTTHLDHSAHQPNAHEPRPGPGVTGSHSARAYRLVDHAIGRNAPSAVRTALAIETAHLLTETDEPTITAALHRWNTRTGIGPRILPNLVADILKERAGQVVDAHTPGPARVAPRRASTTDTRLAEIQALKGGPSPDLRVIEGAAS
ncbi:hypothetical protein [Amycolatopsis thermophila]|uniref:Helix-turn-helix domain-containing protein n=1 Tax=Amycolatopsis thermophila TaxID=206084 RepID=A0ABU0ERK9_9PSEU|nr:hypothetical protein [Amycolatopsis thermophila]MDQ0377921.1 hypothetical protein [Amycolatopsis thermophila]